MQKIQVAQIANMTKNGYYCKFYDRSITTCERFKNSIFVEGQPNTICRKFLFDKCDYAVVSVAGVGDLLLELWYVRVC